MLHLGGDVFAVRVLGEEHRLLELGVGEFAAEIVALVLLLLVLDLLFHVDHQVAFLVQMDIEVFLGHARGGELQLVGFGGFNDVDGRRGGFRTVHPVGVEEIVEDVGHPVVVVSCR